MPKITWLGRTKCRVSAALSEGRSQPLGSGDTKRDVRPVSALKESLRDGGDREGHRFTGFQDRENKGDGGGPGCKLRDMGVPRKESLPAEEALGRLHGGGGIEQGLVVWGQTAQEVFQAKGAL